MRRSGSMSVRMLARALRVTCHPRGDDRPRGLDRGARPGGPEAAPGGELEHSVWDPAGALRPHVEQTGCQQQATVGSRDRRSVGGPGRSARERMAEQGPAGGARRYASPPPHAGGARDIPPSRGRGTQLPRAWQEDSRGLACPTPASLTPARSTRRVGSGPQAARRASLSHVERRRVLSLRAGREGWLVGAVPCSRSTWTGAQVARG